jgi:serine phosphatase RsbU (regulator of sigma subunit)
VAHSDSLLSVPLAVGDGGEAPLGVLNLAGKGGGSFASEDQKLVAAIARQTASAIHQTRLMGRLLSTERLHEELRLASEIHEGLLPECVPDIPGYEVAAALRPASAVGGDYYDFMQQGESIYLLIADVAGHGLGAALLVSTVRSTLRAGCRSGLAPGDVLAQLNDVVGDLSGETGLFATAQVVELRGSCGRVAAAAHPPALRIRPGAGVSRLGQSGPPAGALPGATYPEQSFQLGGGETLILYTDGLLESAGAVGLGGLEASLTAAAEARPRDLVERLLARLNYDEEPTDDRTVLAIHRHQEISP